MNCLPNNNKNKYKTDRHSDIHLYCGVFTHIPWVWQGKFHPHDPHGLSKTEEKMNIDLNCNV